MSITIQIIFLSLSGCKILKRGSFLLNGKKTHEIAFDWWINIQKEMFVERLEQVICNGEDNRWIKGESIRLCYFVISKHINIFFR